jgi:hypothetical protein
LEDAGRVYDTVNGQGLGVINLGDGLGGIGGAGVTSMYRELLDTIKEAVNRTAPQPKPPPPDELPALTLDADFLDTP